MTTTSEPDRRIDRPVFVIGTGRSGTTLCFDILTAHPQLAWPCQLMVFGYRSPLTRAAQTLAELPLLRRFAPRHPVAEAYEFWNRMFSDFGSTARDLDQRDASSGVRQRFRDVIAAQLKAMNRRRFIMKYTGWSRISFFDAIFPDALYVHVVRDGRAVANSLLNVDFWKDTDDPSTWRWGALTPDDQQIWDRSNRSRYVLAGLQWKLLMENITEQGDPLGERFIPVRFEELIDRPQEVMQELLTRLDLADSQSFHDNLDRRPLHDPNQKWKTTIPAADQTLFHQLLGPALQRFGYSTDSGTDVRS